MQFLWKGYASSKAQPCKKMQCSIHWKNVGLQSAFLPTCLVRAFGLWVSLDIFIHRLLRVFFESSPLLLWSFTIPCLSPSLLLFYKNNPVLLFFSLPLVVFATSMACVFPIVLSRGTWHTTACSAPRTVGTHTLWASDATYISIHKADISFCVPNALTYVSQNLCV